MGRAPCCSKKKRLWTIDEDEKLKGFITLNGIGNWQRIPEKCGIARCGKSCRRRWNDYLRPDIKRGHLTSSEKQKITQLHAVVGNRWAFIASHLPMRTDNEIKNYWNTVLKKKQCNENPSYHQLLGEGVVKSALAQPATTTATHVASSQYRAQNHLVEWETVRLEAEARLLRDAKMRSKLGAWPATITAEWRASLAKAPVNTKVTPIPNGSADPRRRPAMSVVAQGCSQHMNATQLPQHQHLSSLMKIPSDPTDILPPLPSHIAWPEIAPSHFIRSGRAQTCKLVSDHNITPLLDNDAALLNAVHSPISDTLVPAKMAGWSAAASYDQPHLSSFAAETTLFCSCLCSVYNCL